ncbi:MAG TPA: hypothetical protein VEZ20_03045 [Allosphingosinicella sp.]|nr:hypothetical protein [Allosphingosinicella sp.]
MRTLILFAVAALGAGCVNESADVEAGQSALMNGMDGGELSEALAGRTAGEPRSCVRLRDVRNTRSAGRDTILFDGPGDLVYVNRARSSCPDIKSWHAIRHRTVGTNICENELIRVFDPNSGIEFGGCSLGEFVPWRRDRS